MKKLFNILLSIISIIAIGLVILSWTEVQAHHYETDYTYSHYNLFNIIERACEQQARFPLYIWY